MNAKTTKLLQQLTAKTERFFGIKPDEASTLQIYKALCLVARDMLAEKRVAFKKAVNEQQAKTVYYSPLDPNVLLVAAKWSTAPPTGKMNREGFNVYIRYDCPFAR
jgi:hypothetical protein